MTCKRCGQCCITANLFLPGVQVGNDPQGLAQFWRYHHCQVVPVVDLEGEETIEVKVPLVCGYLEFDVNGLAACGIYEHRPQICRDAWCPRAKDGD